MQQNLKFCIYKFKLVNKYESIEWVAYFISFVKINKV